MSMKLTVPILILALALVLAAALRTSNRADAAAGNCYSETQGPSEPTVCS